MLNHDRLFKELLHTFFWEFVEAFLPEVVGYLEKTSLVFLDKELFTDVTSGDRHEVDLVVRGKFKGQEAFFLVHVEHQAQSQSDFAYRMFRYFARLHEQHGLPVYPVVLYSHGGKQIDPGKYELQFPDRRVLDFRYRVIQLSCLSWRSFVHHPNPAVCALMARMKIAVRDRPRVKLECLRLLVTLRLDPARVRLISGFIDTYLRLNTREELRFRREASKLSNREEERGVMQIVTSWMEEGLQQGLQQGREQGLQQGREQGLQQGREQGLQQGREQGLLQEAREDIREVLEARFGEAGGVPEKLQDIQDLARLKFLLRQASTVGSIADFLSVLIQTGNHLPD